MKTPVDIRNPYNIFHVVFKSPYPVILFWRDHNGNAATLLVCVIPTIVPCIEYIKIRVENFH